MKLATRVTKDYAAGYRIWRIARDAGITIEDAVCILIDAGLISERATEMIIYREREREQR